MITEPVRFRMELNVAAQHLISAFEEHQEEIAEQVKSGVEIAVKEFDFEREIAEKAKGLIKQTITDFMWKGELRKLIEKKVESIVATIMETEMKNWENQNKDE